jgi:SAM-dependent methyltransferase
VTHRARTVLYGGHSIPLVTDIPLSALPDEEKHMRAESFGDVAELYENFRPGPPANALGWILDGRHVHSVVDLGAGTGACTRLLLDLADQVTAVEPDDRMRAVLATQVPGARALEGRGEAIPVADGSADAVFASSSWHWMDPLLALPEVARVLRPGGTLGVVWSGPDPEGPFIAEARVLLSGQSPDGTTLDNASSASDENLADPVMADADRPSSILEIPSDHSVPFDQPEREVFGWDVPLTADDLIGLLGTFSWIILMEEDTRNHLFSEARRLLEEMLGIVGDVTIDVG